MRFAPSAAKAGDDEETAGRQAQGCLLRWRWVQQEVDGGAEAAAAAMRLKYGRRGVDTRTSREAADGGVL